MWTIFYYPVLLSTLYLVLTIALFMLSNILPAAGFFARLLSSYVSALIATVSGVFISVLLRLAGEGRSSQHATGRIFKYIMRLTTGVEFLIDDPHGYLNTMRPAVFISNHQTELDVLMLATVFPRYCSITAKRSLKKVPFLGWFMMLSHSVFVDRGNATSAKATMGTAAKEMRDARQSVFIFPEGTRSYPKDPTLLPFKKGAFNLAVDAQVPIVPLVVACYSDILHVQSWRFQGGQVLVKVLEPIETVGLKYEDVVDLARDTRDLMLKELVSITEKQKGRPVAVPTQAFGDGVIRASGSDTSIS